MGLATAVPDIVALLVPGNAQDRALPFLAGELAAFPSIADAACMNFPAILMFQVIFLPELLCALAGGAPNVRAQRTAAMAAKRMGRQGVMEGRPLAVRLKG